MFGKLTDSFRILYPQLITISIKQEVFYCTYDDTVGHHNRSLLPDLAKFRNFGKILKVFGNLKKFYIVFGKILNLLWQTITIFCNYWKTIQPSGHTVHNFLEIVAKRGVFIRTV